MDPQRMTGPGAGVVKYDIVTSLSVAGLNGPPVFQTSMMRLISLVTARYNWQQDELCVGQREMARMWSVNERTVKREIKRLTEARVLICKRAGVKGRVARYRLNIQRIVELSQPCWALVGPDFEARMQARHGEPSVKVVALKDYVPDTRPVAAESPWERTCQRLSETDPAMYQAWFAKVDFHGFEAGTLRLRVPSRFAERYIATHLMGPLAGAAEEMFGAVRKVEFV